ncbi:MAG: O-antigen ligase family protein [Symbiobacteriia bacterium]
MPGLVLMGTLALLIYPPYFRGLYFTQEQLITLLITLAVFSLWWAYKWSVGDLRFFGSPLDYFALAAALAWTLSVIVAVNPRGAIQEALKNLNYFLIYWLVAEQVRSRHSLLYRNPRPILGAMYLSALGVALMGLGAAAGVVHYDGAFVGGRIASTVQYANSLAAYLTAAFFVGLGLWTATPHSDAAPATGVRRLWDRARTGIFAGTASVILLTFIFTLSRGAWLVFPVALALFIFLVGAGGRLRAGAYFVATLAAALAASPLMAKGVSAGRPAYIELAVLLALVLGTGLGYLADSYLRRSVRWKVALAAGLAAFLIVGGGTLAGLVAAKPLTLGHTAAEKDGSKILEQGLSVPDPDAEYILTFQVNAAGDAKKPYAWRVTVYGYDPDTGANRVLANQAGKPTSGWQSEQVKIAPSHGLTRVTVQLSNYYAGTQATFRGTTVQSSEGEVVAHPGFALAKALPSSLYRRISEISLGTSNAESRLSFGSDALKIIRDYPVLGVGGRGWAAAFLKYQSYGYVSREVHNHFLQTWVDTGTVGFFAWLALWGALLYLGFRRVRRGGAVAADDLTESANARLMLGGVLAAAIAIGIHSFIDFNLSLSAISFYLWALIGLTAVPGDAPIAEDGRLKSARPKAVVPEVALPLVIAVAGLFFAGRLLLGYNAGAQAVALMKAGKAEQAKIAYLRAIAYDPWTASFYIDLGQMDRSIVEVEHGIALDSLNPQYHQVLGTLYLRQNKMAEGLAEMDKSVALEPFQQQVYQQVAQVDYGIGEGLFQAGKADLAKPFLQRVLDLRQQAVDRVALIPKTVPVAYRLNAHTPAFSLTVGKAQALLGQRPNALVSLVNATRGKETLAEANVWLAALYAVDKNSQEAAPYLARIKAAGQQAESRYADVFLMLTASS